MARATESDWRDWPVPEVYPSTYLAYASERGLSVEQVLRESGLRPDVLDTREAALTLAELERLVTVIIARTGDLGAGFEIGWRLPPTAFGNLGHAMIASATVGDAILLCQRFWQMLGRGMALDVDASGELCVLSFAPEITVHEAFRRIMLESTIASVHRGVVSLVAEASAESETWFDFPEPVHADRVRAKLHSVRYAMPATQFRFPARLLDRPLAMASATGLRAAIERCEQEAAILDLGDPVSTRVQKELRLGTSGYPSLDETAKRLHTTSRTLRRRLREQGTSYSTLLDAARRRDAIRLLDNRSLDIQRIAAWMGYADPANFTRAFRQWTGKTPSQYRATR